MAITILPQGPEGLGSILGRSLGETISGGLQNLAQSKLQQLQQRNAIQQSPMSFMEQQQPQYNQFSGYQQQPTLQGLQSSSLQQQTPNVQFTGAQPRQQSLLANLSQPQRSQLREALSHPEIKDNYAPKALRGIQNLLDQYEEPKKESKKSKRAVAEQEQDVVVPQRSNRGAKRLSAQEETQGQLPSAQLGSSKGQKALPVVQSSPAIAKDIATPTKSEQKQAVQSLSPEAKKIEDKLPSIDDSAKKKAQDWRKVTGTQKKYLERADSLKEEFIVPKSAAEIKEAYNETKPVYDHINGAYKAAEDNEFRLNRMETLIDKGNLAAPLTSALLETLKNGIGGYGIDLSGVFLNQDSQEFQKLSTDFLKTVKEIFGARVTEGEVGMFLRTVPTLMQSDEGKKRVIYNLRLFNEATKIRKNSMDAVIRANGGKRPMNMEYLADEIAKPELDALASKFTEGFKGQEKGILNRAIHSALPGLNYLGL